MLSSHHKSKILQKMKVPKDTEIGIHRFLDYFIYPIALIGPIMTIPQVTKIWSTQSASDLSLATWVTYIVIAFFWLFYGILHNEKPLIFINIIWVIIMTILVIGIVNFS